MGATLAIGAAGAAAGTPAFLTVTTQYVVAVEGSVLSSVAGATVRALGGQAPTRNRFAIDIAMAALGPLLEKITGQWYGDAVGLGLDLM